MQSIIFIQQIGEEGGRSQGIISRLLRGRRGKRRRGENYFTIIKKMERTGDDRLLIPGREKKNRENTNL